MDSIYTRYKEDVKFHALVTIMLTILVDNKTTYHDLQDAAVFASIKHMQMTNAVISPKIREFVTG